MYGIIKTLIINAINCIGVPIIRKFLCEYFPNALVIKFERYPPAVIKLDAPATAMAIKKGYGLTPSS